MAGSQVAGGLLGKAPDLSDLDAGDLKMSIDFRQVYATLLDHWLGVSARDVLGASFDTLPLLRTSN